MLLQDNYVKGGLSSATHPLQLPYEIYRICLRYLRDYFTSNILSLEIWLVYAF